MSKRVYPVPEIILDDHIEIKDSERGSMDNDARIMRIPLLDTPQCRHVRAHEMAHAKYSPTKPTCPSGVKPITIQRVEDMRMNVICRHQGLHDAMDAPIVSDSTMWERLLTGEREILTAGISTYDTGDWPEFVKRANPSDDDIALIESICKALRDNPSWANTQRQARAVENYLSTEPPEPEPSPGDDEDNSADGSDDPSDDPPSESGESEGSADDDSGDDSEPSDDDSDASSGNSESDDSDDESDGNSDGSGDPDDDMPEDGDPVDLSDSVLDDMVDKALEDDANKSEQTPYEKGLEILTNCERHYARGEAKVVPAKVVEQRMPKRLPPNKFKSRAKVPADKGMVPKHMNRYCTDQAIFAGRGRKRSQGGTILIDASSSMSLSSEQVDRMMELAPLGTIATYSGGYYHGQDDLIWVIAKNGKRAVGRLTPPGPCNKVDVPALEWMVKHEPPYFWVCDGGVSGKAPNGNGEKFGKNIYAICKAMVEKYGIIMVPNIEDLPDVMEETLGKRR